MTGEPMKTKADADTGMGIILLLAAAPPGKRPTEAAFADMSARCHAEERAADAKFRETVTALCEITRRPLSWPAKRVLIEEAVVHVEALMPSVTQPPPPIAGTNQDQKEQPSATRVVRPEAAGVRDDTNQPAADGGAMTGGGHDASDETM